MSDRLNVPILPESLPINVHRRLGEGDLADVADGETLLLLAGNHEVDPGGCRQGACQQSDCQ